MKQYTKDVVYVGGGMGLRRAPSHIPEWEQSMLHKYIELIFDRGTKVIQWRKNNLFNKGCWNNWMLIRKKVNFYLNVTCFIKIDSKSICKTQNYEIFMRKFSLTGVRQQISRHNTKSVIIEDKVDKVNCIKIFFKMLCETN